MAKATEQKATEKPGRKKLNAFGTPFEPTTVGQSLIGTLDKINTGKTQFGEAEFLQIIEDGTGELFSVVVSSSMANIDFVELIGKRLEVEYDGEQESKNYKGKTFKKFNVYEMED